MEWGARCRLPAGQGRPLLPLLYIPLLYHITAKKSSYYSRKRGTFLEYKDARDVLDYQETVFVCYVIGADYWIN
jgi:hypothetical protein